MIATFELLGANGGEPITVLPGAPRLVGRLATCDVPIYDGSISRDHATVCAVEGGLEVKDLGSTNGTFVNGVRVYELIAKDGDTVTFGAISMRLRKLSTPTGPVKEELADSQSRIIRRVPIKSGNLSRISGVISGSVKRPAELGGPVDADVRERSAGSGSSVLSLVESLPDDRLATKLEVLLEVSLELARQQDLDALLRRIAELIFTIAAVDRVCIMTVEGETLELVPRIARNRRGTPINPKIVPRALAYQAVADRVALLSEDLARDERFDSDSVRLERQRSALCIPLAGDRTEVLGILYADRLSTEQPLGEADLEFMVALANLAAVAIENRQLQDRGRRESEALDKLRRLLSPNDAKEMAAQSDVAMSAVAKRPVVIMVTEICGFAASVEQRSAAEIGEVANAYCGKVIETIFQYGGTLDHVVGHTVIALWGSPISRPDDGDRALRAAQEIGQGIAALSAQWKKRGRPGLDVGIGIGFGEVFVGNVGTRQRSEYTVIGRAAEQAIGLARSARPGEILVGEELLARASAPRAERVKNDFDGKVFRIL